MAEAPCGRLTYAAPWPDLPLHIAFAGMTFTPDRLLANRQCDRIALPESLGAAGSKRRADYIAGRLCAHAVIDRLGGDGPRVGRHADGAPCWPPGFCGSISHAGGHAVAVAARTGRYRSLGVDVEQMLSPDQADALLPLALTPRERSRFSAYPPEFATTLIFSLKESLFKLLYPLTGVTFFHENAEVLFFGYDGRANLRLLRTLSSECPSGMSFPASWRYCDKRIFSIIAC